MATEPRLSSSPTQCTQHDRIALANKLYREFHARCFWHSPADLLITEELIPFVVRGLRTHGVIVVFSWRNSCDDRRQVSNLY